MNTEITHTAGLLVAMDGAAGTTYITSAIHPTLKPIAEGFNASDARRLVACWNACNGIPTETLESMGANSFFRMRELAADEAINSVKVRAEIARLQSQNAVLRSALEALTEWGRTHTSPLDANSPHELLTAACAALVAATPEPVQRDERTLVERETPRLREEVRAMLGRDIPHVSSFVAAIKHYRNHTGCMLFEAKEAVERIRDAAAESDPWHLFYIEATDCDGTHGFIVSAQSGSESKAEELARAAVDDSIDHRASEIGHCRKLGLTDSDIFESVGLLAGH